MTTREVSGWAIGWAMFAATMMWIVGAFHVLAGLAAIVEDELYVLTPEYLYQLDVTTWGWIHLIMGIIVILAGVGVLRGAVWARTLGVILAIISILVSFAWLPWYPVWAILLIAAGVFVIWALTVHGRDVTAT